MPEPVGEIVEVYWAAHGSEAHFLRNMLADEGIQARVVNEPLTGVIGEVPAGDTAPRLWVHKTDEDRARRLLADWERLRARPRPDAEPADTWKCPTCGEPVDADFDLCWNCQSPRT